MKNILIDLSKILPNKIFAMLYDVVRVSTELDLDLFIIGATSRDIIMTGVYGIKVPRSTDDLDLGVAVKTWTAYGKLKSRLTADFGFKQDQKQEQRLWRAGEKMDIIPFGGLETAEGEIALPPDGDVKMSVAGFMEAFHDAVSVPLNDLSVRVGSLRGIVLLKFVAYSDRPAERAKDVQDILFIAKNYLDAGADEKLYESESDLLDDDFDYALAGARILGRDIGAIMTPTTSTIILETLDGLCDQSDESESTGALLQQIKKGVGERI